MRFDVHESYVLKQIDFDLSSVEMDIQPLMGHLPLGLQNPPCHFPCRIFFFPIADLLSICECRRHGFNPWSGKIPHTLEKLSSCATFSELVLQSSSLNKRSHPNEKPVHCNWRVAPTCHSQRKPQCRNEDPVLLKINIKNK